MNFLWVIRQKERKSFFLLHLLTKCELIHTIKEDNSPEQYEDKNGLEVKQVKNTFCNPDFAKNMNINPIFAAVKRER